MARTRAGGLLAAVLVMAVAATSCTSPEPTDESGATAPPAASSTPDPPTDTPSEPATPDPPSPTPDGGPGDGNPGAGDPGSGGPGSGGPGSGGPGSGGPGPEASCARTTLRDLSPAQRAAQLLMLGVPAEASEPDTTVTSAVADLQVGAVILTGRSERGVQATRALVDQLDALVPRGEGPGIGLEVAVDQEGGQVQVLQGPGFDIMPTAATQGTWPDARLQRMSARWAGQLRAAGVTLNLAPVADVVPPGRENAPIGQFDRGFAAAPGPVADSVAAFVRGSLDGGVGTVVKHFPGLGRASGNTDDTAGVVDDETRRGDPYLRPFRAGLAAGSPYVMMSTARYTRLDPDTAAAFSPYVVQTMLRDDLGFDGLVISDDVGVATSVQEIPVGQRAVRFVAAGSDVVLTVVTSQAGEMTQALVARAEQSPGFRARVDGSALRVLRRKVALGVLSCRGG